MKRVFTQRNHSEFIFSIIMLLNRNCKKIERDYGAPLRHIAINESRFNGNHSNAESAAAPFRNSKYTGRAGYSAVISESRA